MKYLCIKGLAIVSALMFSNAAAAQSALPQPIPHPKTNETKLPEDASLEETQLWLKEQILAYSRYKLIMRFPNKSYYYAHEVKAINFEGCKLTYLHITTDSSLKGKVLATHRSKIKVALSLLDYSRVVLRSGVRDSGSYTVDAHTAAQKFIIEHQYEFRSGSNVKRDNRPMGQISFVFPSEDKAKEVIQALSHAIKLCEVQKATKVE